MWSEVMDADAFAAFEEAGDPFDPEVAARLERFILSAGGSEEAEALYLQVPRPDAGGGGAAEGPRVAGRGLRRLCEAVSRGIGRVGQVFDRLDDARVDMVVERLAAARRIVVFGAGRERLQIMGLAMRLFHMGLEASVAGDMTAPPVGQGRCLSGGLRAGLAVHGRGDDAGGQGRRGPR